MTDFSQLDPETRAFAYVGQFLRRWSRMEASLHNAIASVLKIETIPMQILSVNIEFRKKAETLGGLLAVSPDYNDTEKKANKRVLNDLADYSKTRNIVAHCAFGPDSTNKGVEFFHIKAGGKFELPKEVWLDEKFQTEGQTIAGYQSF